MLSIPAGPLHFARAQEAYPTSSENTNGRARVDYLVRHYVPLCANLTLAQRAVRLMIFVMNWIGLSQS